MFSTILLKKEGWKEAKFVKHDQIWHITTFFNAGGITPTIIDAQLRVFHSTHYMFHFLVKNWLIEV